MGDIGSEIADAIGKHVLENSDMDMMPIVGGFTLSAEIVDPETGQINLVTIQDATLPMWTEWGMLMARIAEVAADWQVMGEIEYEGYDE